MINISNPYLSLAIQTELYNLRLITSIEYDRTEFPISYLRSIRKIDIANCSTLDGIWHLINLEVLNVFNEATNIELGIYNKVEDFSPIASLKKLKKLYILNDFHIKNLDLSGLIELEELVVLSCQNIETISGIKQLPKLKKLIFVGNNHQCLMDFDPSFETLKKIPQVILDIVFYHQNFVSNSTNSKWIFEKEQPNVLFAEKIGFGEIYIMKPPTVEEMYKKALAILQDILKPGMSDYEIISAVYNFIITYLSYDWETLKEREKYFSKRAYYPLLINDLMNKFREINSSYGAFFSKKVVCEGYVNMMQFLLNIVGFNTKVVYNSIKIRNSNNFDHAAIAINYGDSWYFSDPEFYRANNDKILMTLEEFEIDHKLSQMDKRMYRLLNKKK